MASAARAINKLFVGNIPWTVGSNELRQYFSQFGNVTNAAVIFDRNTGLSRGYGFVAFSNQNGYSSAVSKQKHSLEGGNLILQPANVMPSH